MIVIKKNASGCTFQPRKIEMLSPNDATYNIITFCQLMSVACILQNFYSNRICFNVVILFRVCIFQTLYRSVTFAGYIGLLTGERMNGYTMSVDARHGRVYSIRYARGFVVTLIPILHGDVIKWNYLTSYWPFVRGIRWIPRTKASDAALWYFLWSVLE